MLSTDDPALKFALTPNLWDEGSSAQPSTLLALDASVTDGILLIPELESKVQDVLDACDKKDLIQLTRLATSTHGFVRDDARRVAWPLLLGCNVDQLDKDDRTWEQLPKHKDEEQVALDVNRSFVYYPKSVSERHRDHLRKELSDLIVSVLRNNPYLCYFQGFHDIVQVILLVLGTSAAARSAVTRLSLLRIRDFLLPTIAAAESHLRLLPAILYAADHQLFTHLLGATKPTPFFALAATLTLYAHEIEEYGDIARLFDFLLASEAVVPVYLFAVIIISRKKELLNVEEDEPDMLHSILSKMPKPLDLDGLIQQTDRLMLLHPPERLADRAWSKTSQYSTLKTTHDNQLASKQTLSDGSHYFTMHAEQVRRADATAKSRARLRAAAKRYRRPAIMTTSAIIVAIIGMYLSRNGSMVAASHHDWLSLLINGRQQLVGLMARLWHLG